VGSLTEADIEELTRGVDDPVAFIEVAIGESLWPKQQEIAHAVDKYRRVAVKACNASGKSFLLGRLIPWWTCKYPLDGKVLVTASGWQQVRNIASVEYMAARRKAKINLPELNANAEAKDEEGRPIIIGMAPKNQVRMQGHHAGHILIIVDEAAGDEIPWEAIEGNLAGGDAHLVLLGNPTVSGGYFYDAFQGKGGFHCITIDAFDTPNLGGFTLEQLRALPPDLPKEDPIFEDDKEPYPGLTKRYWVYEKFHQWGENSPHWQSRVRGEFPSEGEDACFPMAWLRDAEKRQPLENNERERVGIDVAGPGDDETVCYRTKGGNVIGFKAWHGLIAKEKAMEYLEPFKPEIDNISVDVIGVGTYFPDDMEKAGFPITRVNVGQPPHKDKEYNSRKAEIYWNVRNLFKDGLIAGLTDETTIQQLAGIRYFEDDKGRICIEPKEKAAKRGVKSPDRAEALILALANTEPAILKVYRAMALARARQEGTIAPGVAEEAAPAPSPRKDTTYHRTMDKLTTGGTACHHCKLPIGNSRIMQGQYSFHKECAQKMGVI